MKRSAKPTTGLTKALAACAGIVLACLIVEGAARFYFADPRLGLETTRLRLSGEKAFKPIHSRCIGQPYLFYVPAPGVRDHNEQGYRGKAVPMRRQPNTFRVLCMGGSTTYGVESLWRGTSYPDQLEKILDAERPEGVVDVEVINAGLVRATTAELLTHYHFKFHYFQPDLVIINTGGNDPGVEANYQPDYSHIRQPFNIPQPLSQFGRVVLKSRFAAWIVMQMLYGRNPGNAYIEREDDIPPPTLWHPNVFHSEIDPSLLNSDAELAFTHNLNTLIDEILKDGAQVLLVPFRLNPEQNRHSRWYGSQIKRHEPILKRISKERGLALAPFPADVISEKNWVDFCHLNRDGCRQKAEHIAEYARDLLAAFQSPDRIGKNGK